MILSYFQQNQGYGFTPRVYLVIHFAIHFFGKKHLLDHLVYAIHRGVTLWFLIEVHMGIMEKSFKKGLKYHLNSELLSKNTLRGSGSN